MTKKEIDLAYFKNKLQDFAAQTELLISQVNDASKIVELDQNSVGRLSRVDALQGQAMAIASANRQKEQLHEIHDALHRIDSGQFAYCSECGEDIAVARLELNPVVRTCIKCAQELEISNK